MKRVMKACASKRTGIVLAWQMALASYEYSRIHGLSIVEATKGAASLFRDYLK